MSARPSILWPFALAATIFAASSQSRLAAPDIALEFSPDKIAHFLVFGLLATAVIRLPALRSRGWRGATIAALSVMLYGGLDEWRQSLTPDRSVELADWIADSLGAIVASVVYLGWPMYRRILELPVGRTKKAADDAAASVENG